MRGKPLARGSVALTSLTSLASLACLLALVAPASAHVSVTPPTANQGSFARLTFRIPNEREDSSCTKVEISFPIDKGLVAVRVHPHAGWTHVMEKSELAQPIETGTGEITEVVSRVTWTADADSSVKPGEFEEFDVTLGPLPSNTNAIEFAALQTYSNSEVVRWVEPVVEGKEPPDRPVPRLSLTRPPGEGGAGAPPTSGEVRSARMFGIAGLVTGLLGLLAGAGAFATRRRSVGAAASTGGRGDAPS